MGISRYRLVVIPGICYPDTKPVQPELGEVGVEVEPAITGKMQTPERGDSLGNVRVVG